MSMYDDMAAAAADLLQEFGKTITLTRYASASYDPITKAYTSGGATTYTAYAVEDEYKATEIDGTRIQMGDRRFLVAATVEPRLGDTLTVDGDNLKIVAPIKPLQPGSLALYYEVQARG